MNRKSPATVSGIFFIFALYLSKLRSFNDHSVSCIKQSFRTRTAFFCIFAVAYFAIRFC